jgi:toxin-antitoxin system PIN domain toxin
MIYLPDVNVWIALTSDRHIHHAIASEWLQSVAEDRIAFCRITELGFLRLLTNARVMSEDVLSASEAWAVYDEWRADSRVIFLPELPDFSVLWSRNGRAIQGGPNAWTDAYLGVFAEHVDATLVTLDRKFSAPTGGSITTLGAQL